jgi:hypothetical protein
MVAWQDRRGWSAATSIDEVLERMDVIAAELPAADGVATFDRMYRQVTLLVRQAELTDRFGAGEFVARLDVHFANLFFQAVEADLCGTPVPRAWAPLFDQRSRPDTHPIQFALAGMNAHIAHDLALAVVTTCQELGIEPEDETPEHADFTLTNEILREAAEEIKEWFATGIVATIDRLGGKVDDGFAMFALHTGRAAAWETAEVMWSLQDNPRMHRLFVGSLARTVALTSRGILL